MARPTREHLAHTLGCVEQLFYDFPDEETAWTAVYYLADLLLWINLEIKAARDAAAYGPGGVRSPDGGGTIGAHTVGRHGLGRPVEERLDWGTDAEDEANGAKPRQRGNANEHQPPVELADHVYQHLKRLRQTWYRELGGQVTGMRNGAHDAANWPHRTADTEGMSVSGGS